MCPKETLLMHALIAIILSFTGVGVQAALLGRAPATPGGNDYQAYYDTDLNITWLADANYAKTSGYDPDGLMTWNEAQSWIPSLNASNHLGVELTRFRGRFSVWDSSGLGQHSPFVVDG